MQSIPLPTILETLDILLAEAYDGPPDPSATWFVDNAPDSGVLGALKGITAAEASTSVDASQKPGTTIAANVEHLRWSLANVNATLRGSPYQANWSESWQTLAVTAPEWDRLRDDLRAEYETLRQALQKVADLQGEYLVGSFALIPHAAFHLGLIRQMAERVRLGKG
jgi:hypothetical protein